MRRTLALALLIGCTTPSGSAPPPRPEAIMQHDAALAAFSARTLDEILRRFPVYATLQGDHRADDRWPDLTAAGEASYRTWLMQKKAELAALTSEPLSAEGTVDAAMIGTFIDYAVFAIDELREAEFNPMTYTGTIGDGLDPLVTRSFGTPASRLAALRGRLEGLPAVVAAARQRLRGSSPLHLDTAVRQAQGLLGLLGTLPSAETLGPGRQQALEGPIKTARAALEDLVAYLDRDLRARPARSERLGRALFTRKLRYELDDEVDPDALAASARALMARTLDEMVETARELWPTLGRGPLPPHATADEKKALVRAALDVLAQDHPTNETIVRDASRLLDEATRFVRERNLVRLPDEPCRVIEMPEYRRGVAVAYCDASGPLEEKPETFFAISPTPSDWTPERARSFYREYNASMLADLVVHEAMPGHFLQLMANNRFPSKLRAVLSSGPFVEGWAVYTEWLMARHGFGGPRVRMMRQKMVLRLCANAILDHGVHAGSMTEQEAMALMMGEAFQEEGEAAGKWNRARMTSAQLTTYFYGFTAMLALRHEHERRPGFSERAFHDEVLAHGSPSIRHLRRLLDHPAR